MQKVCKICGKIFDDDTKSQICSEDCKRRAKIISQSKYYIKHKAEINQKRAERLRKNENKVVYKATAIKPKETTQSDIVIDTLNKSIADNLELLDAVRDELSKIVNELKAKQSAYDSKDLELLHAMEGAQSDSALLEYAKQCKNNRKGRRDYKNYILFLVSILKSIPQNTKQSFDKTKETQNYKNIYYSIKY